MYMPLCVLSCLYTADRRYGTNGRCPPSVCTTKKTVKQPEWRWPYRIVTVMRRAGTVSSIGLCENKMAGDGAVSVKPDSGENDVRSDHRFCPPWKPPTPLQPPPRMEVLQTEIKIKNKCLGVIIISRSWPKDSLVSQPCNNNDCYNVPSELFRLSSTCTRTCGCYYNNYDCFVLFFFQTRSLRHYTIKIRTRKAGFYLSLTNELFGVYFIVTKFSSNNYYTASVYETLGWRDSKLYYPGMAP